MNEIEFKYVRVADIQPFWRYAVGPTAGHSPAIPYYRLAAAVAFFELTKSALPWAGVVLYKRRWWRGIEVLREYKPPADYEGPWMPSL